MPVTQLAALGARARSEWRLKLRWAVILNAVFLVGYVGVQRVHLGTPREIPLTALDRLIPFVPEAAWVYESLFVFVTLSFLNLQSGSMIRRQGREILLMMAVGFAIFFLLPTTVPRAGVASGVALYDWIVWVDRPLNAFPSLHAGLCMHTLAVTWQRSERWRWRLGAGVWAIAILWATLATQQHRVLDLAAGMVLGLAVAGGAWWRDRESAKRSR